MIKEVGQKYKVLPKEDVLNFSAGEIVELILIQDDKLSVYENERGDISCLFDIDHEDCEVELVEVDTEEHEDNSQEVATDSDLRTQIKKGDMVVTVFPKEKVGEREFSKIINGTILDRIQSDYDQDLHSKARFGEFGEGGYIKAIYRPKKDGDNITFEPVWKRKEQYYSLVCPLTKEMLCLGEKGGLSWDTTYVTKKQHKFTQDMIDRLPHQDFVKTLEKIKIQTK